MIIITENIDHFATYHEFLGYAPKSSLFFDIETTGFSPQSSFLFLIGMLYQENDCWKLTQLLAEEPEDECLLLRIFLETADRYETLIHFNGSTFDLPYLIKKAQILHLPHSLEHLRSLDLYRIFRPLGKLLSLENMKQQTLETFLGWKRTDQLTGKDMICLFRQYTDSRRNSDNPRSDSARLQTLLLLHNHDDMLGMTKLTCMAAYLALRDGNISSVTFCGFRETIRLCLTFTLSTAVPIPFSLSGQKSAPDRLSATSFYSDYALTVEGAHGTLSLPVYQGTLFHFFSDYKNYYYLPYEDQAIHKSVASFVDKTCRIPAKASNCYIKKSGTFLPQPEEIVSPIFKRSYEENQLYFICNESFIEHTPLQKTYLSAVLQILLA